MSRILSGYSDNDFQTLLVQAGLFFDIQNDLEDYTFFVNTSGELEIKKGANIIATFSTSQVDINNLILSSASFNEIDIGNVSNTKVLSTDREIKLLDVGNTNFSIINENNRLDLRDTSHNNTLSLNGNSILSVVNTGYVGIGTTSPTEVLTVQGNGLISNNLTVNGDCSFDSGTFHIDSTNNKIQCFTQNTSYTPELLVYPTSNAKFFVGKNEYNVTGGSSSIFLNGGFQDINTNTGCEIECYKSSNLNAWELNFYGVDSEPTRLTRETSLLASLNQSGDFYVSNDINFSDYSGGGYILTIDKSLETLTTQGDVNMNLGDLNVPQGDIDIGFLQNYKINNTSVLNSSTLGSGVINSSLTSVGNLTSLNVDNNVVIGGDLEVNGTTTTFNSETVSIQDSLMKLANNNSADTVDTGFYSLYNNGTTRFSGLFRDASDNKFKFFTGTTIEPSTTVDVSSGGFTLGDVQVKNIDCNTVNINSGGSTSEISYTSTSREYRAGVNGTEYTIYDNTASLFRLAIDSSGNMDLKTGAYKINNSEVLSSTTLGSGVVNSSLTNVGTLSDLTVSNTISAYGMAFGSDGSVGFGGNQLTLSGKNFIDIRINNAGSPSRMFFNTTELDIKTNTDMNNYNLQNIGILGTTGSCNLGHHSSGNNILTVDEPNDTITTYGNITMNSGSLDIVSGNVDIGFLNDYQINSNSVLNSTTLGTGVINSSLTSVGTLSSLTVSGDLTVDTNTLYIDSTNNEVGIGTLNPNSQFHMINDNVQTATTSTATYIDYDFSGDLIIERRHDPDVDSTIGYVGPSLEFRTNNGVETWSTGFINGSVDSFGTSQWSGGMGFYIKPSGSSLTPSDTRSKGENYDLYSLMGNNTIYHPSSINVGIGITNPTSDLHVYNSALSTITAETTSTTGTTKYQLTTNGTDYSIRAYGSALGGGLANILQIFDETAFTSRMDVSSTGVYVPNNLTVNSVMNVTSGDIQKNGTDIDDIPFYDLEKTTSQTLTTNTPTDVVWTSTSNRGGFSGTTTITFPSTGLYSCHYSIGFAFSTAGSRKSQLVYNGRNFGEFFMFNCDGVEVLTGSAIINVTTTTPTLSLEVEQTSGGNLSLIVGDSHLTIAKIGNSV